MSTVHHPAEDLLAAYAAGTLAEAPSLIVATHMALCPACRAEVRRLEAVGGLMLEDMPEAPVTDDLLSAILAEIDMGGGASLAVKARPRPMAGSHAPTLPQPLRGYVGGDLDQVRWSRVIRGVEEAEVLCGSSAKVRMLRIKAGMAMPRHTHQGSELTLVLAGGFSDEMGHYGRGDFATVDGSVDHSPVADPDGDCVCLAVMDAPLRLTGPIGRLLNPFVKF